MDLYLCDYTFRRTDIVDEFESVIWTERYSSSGDCTLSVEDTGDNRARFTPGFLLSTDGSQELMIMDTVNIKEGEIVCKGNTLPEFLKSRPFRNRWQGDKSAWSFTAQTAGAIVNTIISSLVNPATLLTNGTVLTSAQGAANAIVGLTAATAPSSTNPLTISVNYGNVYDAIKQVADADSMGFTIYVPALDGSGNTVFKAYYGKDRRTNNGVNTPVIFAPTLDNLSGVEELHSNKGRLDVVYVVPQGITAQSQIVKVAAAGTGAASSWGLKSMIVDASDISVADYSSTDLTKVLTQRGLNTLINNNYIRTVDGQIVPQGPYQYGVHYNLGDIVELRGTTVGEYSGAQITEYIRAQDNTGEQAYPTLSVVI